MRSRLVLLLLIVCVALPAFADDRSTYMAPLKRTGRSLGNTLDSWKNDAEDYAGMGDEAAESFMCSDPAFFVLRHYNATSDDKYWVLKGALRVPAAGFAYRFTMLGMRGPEAFARLDVGQVITPQYRGQPPQGSLQVMKKFNLPQGIGLIHIQVAGGSMDRSVQEIRCDITSVKEPQEPQE